MSDATMTAARPTGVPLTADNVADAVECRDTDGTHVRIGHNMWFLNDGLQMTDRLMVRDAPILGTVVTKWRKP